MHFVLESAIYKYTRFKIKTHNFKIAFNSSSSVSRELFYDNKSRSLDFKFITAYLCPGDTYVDVGSNIGTTLIPAAMSIYPGFAIGVEPNNKIYKFLLNNLSINNIIGSVCTFNVALGASRGYIHLSNDRSDDMNHVTDESARGGGGYQAKQVVRLYLYWVGWYRFIKGRCRGL